MMSMFPPPPPIFRGVKENRRMISMFPPPPFFRGVEKRSNDMMMWFNPRFGGCERNQRTPITFRWELPTVETTCNVCLQHDTIPMYHMHRQLPPPPMGMESKPLLFCVCCVYVGAIGGTLHRHATTVLDIFEVSPTNSYKKTTCVLLGKLTQSGLVEAPPLQTVF